MPLYSMQTTWVPQQVYDEIDSIKGSLFSTKERLEVWIWLVRMLWLNRNPNVSLRIYQKRATNVALLGMLVWELSRPYPKFWVVFICQKYIPGQNGLIHVFGGKGSHTWNAIVQAWSMLKEGYKPRLGRGDIPFQYGDWHLKRPLCHLVPYVHFWLRFKGEACLAG